MKKQLFSIFGPVILAAVLIVVLFFSPVKINQHDPALLKEAASSMSGNILRGDDVKKQALSTDQYVPFFGSSELSRISPFHPSVLAEKYQRGYTPFLLGAPGTQSMAQFMMMQSLGNDLKNRKVVFVISPQWFVRDGLKQAYFQAYYSPEQTLNWLLHLKKIDESDRYLAKRLVQYKVKDARTDEMLRNVAAGKLPSTFDKRISQLKLNLFSREDELFSTIGLRSKQKQIDASAKQLPDQYNEADLKKLANKIGSEQTSDNSLQIQNKFFRGLRKHLPELRNKQNKLDYRYSKEFSDFQLALDQLAKEHADVLFIIPPVNGKWSKYTGLSQEMLQQFSTKVKYQLQSQGFNNIADFTNDNNTNYFMQDTIHLGWQGWLAADQKIAPFLKGNKQEAQNYQMNNAYFLSKKWQQQNPATIK